MLSQPPYFTEFAQTPGKLGTPLWKLMGMRIKNEDKNTDYKHFFIFLLFYMPKYKFSYFPYRVLVCKKYLVWCPKPSIASVGALLGRHHRFAYFHLCVCCDLMLCIICARALSVKYTSMHQPIFIDSTECLCTFVSLTWCLYRLPGWCWRGARPLRRPPRWWGGAGTEPPGPQTALLPPWSHDHLAAGDV